MSEEFPRAPGAPARSSPDGAVALMRELDGLKTTAPGIADLSERGLARMIDLGTGYGLLLALGVLAAFVAMKTGHMPSSPELYNSRSLDRTGAIAFDVLILMAAIAYEVGPTLIGRRSLGKRLLNLTIVNSEGRRASFGQTAIRFATWFIPFVLLIIGLSATFPGFLSMLFFVGTLALFASIWVSMIRDDDNRGWHDRIAGTWVVRPR